MVEKSAGSTDLILPQDDYCVNHPAVTGQRCQILSE